MEWISIKEKLPETKNIYNWIHDSNKVLIWTDEGCKMSTFTRRYRMNRGGNLILQNEFWHDGPNVTHWMELPKSPEL
jgi:hypothetical protein